MLNSDVQLKAEGIVSSYFLFYVHPSLIYLYMCVCDIKFLAMLSDTL